MVEYPKYTRDEQKNVKLSTEQVAAMVAEYKAGGISKSQLALKYKITRPTLSYWLLTPEERDEKNRMKKTRTYNPVVYRKYLDRKLEVSGEAMRAYRKQIKDNSKAKKEL
jgi:transposase-like protein